MIKYIYSESVALVANITKLATANKTKLSRARLYVSALWLQEIINLTIICH